VPRARSATSSQRRGRRLPRTPRGRGAVLWLVWTACRLAGAVGPALSGARWGRWGSKVSPKLFVAKEYVLKHIRLKHADKVDAQRERVRPGFRARARVSAPVVGARAVRAPRCAVRRHRRPGLGEVKRERRARAPRAGRALHTPGQEPGDEVQST